MDRFSAFCECYEVALLVGHPPAADLRAQLRRTRAQEASFVGWSTTRGPGGRARQMEAAVQVERVKDKDARRAINRAGWDADIAVCCRWVDHVRRCVRRQRKGLFTPRLWLRHHLELQARRRRRTLQTWIDAALLGNHPRLTAQLENLLAPLLKAVEGVAPGLEQTPDLYGRERTKWGRVALARLRGIGGPGTENRAKTVRYLSGVVKRERRRARSAAWIRVNLNEMETLARRIKAATSAHPEPRPSRVAGNSSQRSRPARAPAGER